MPTSTAVAGRTGRLALAGVLAISLSACAPVFSDLQSAKLVEPGQAELTGSVGTVKFSDPDDEDSGRVQDQFGLQAGFGLHEAVELRGRFEHVTVAGENGPSAQVLGLGPKIRLVEDRLALYVPVGRAFGGDEDDDFGDSWAVHPTLLVTLPAHANVEVNASAKYLIPLSAEDADNQWAFNLGLGLGPNLEKWAIRPEAGVLLNPDDGGRFYHFSLGVSVRP